MKKSVLIIGGGISGLAAAHHFQKEAREAVDYRILESGQRLGGKIHTVKEHGFTVEAGPDSFLPRKTAVLDLCRDLGLADALIDANNAGLFVWSHGALIPMPEGMMMMAPAKIGPFLKSNLISWPGKIRMGLEAVVPARRTTGDESLGSFVRRRLGQEALDKIAGPLFAGIYSGNPETLSLLSTFPMFADMERKHGGLLRSMLAQKSTASQAPRAHSSFLSLRNGLQTMVDAIERQLPSDAILRGKRVSQVVRTRQRFEVKTQDGERLGADALLFTTPTHVTAEVLKSFDPVLAQRLNGIRYVSTATVSLGFRRAYVPHALNGTGFIVAQKEKRRVTACTWSSIKFEQRAPEGFVLLRVFMGGFRAPGLADLPEDDLVKIALEELRITMQIKATPVLAKAYRWPQASPQYEVGHAERIAEIERLAAGHQGLHLAGAAYHGGGVPDCIQSGKEEAKKIVEALTTEESNAALCAARMETK